MSALRSWRAGALGVALAVTSGCGADPVPPEAVDLPDGLSVYVDQSRAERAGRDVFVRLVEETDRRVTALRAEITSPRFGAVEWTGEKEFDNEADLDFVLPRGTCGEGSDADVRLTYRVDDGPEQVSETVAIDRYGALGLFLDRDCAEATLRGAADVSVGASRIVGRGGSSVFEVPVTLSPTGEGEAVRFLGFEGTVLFAQTGDSASEEVIEPIPLDGSPVTVLLRLVPARCDPHALAEDKVGTLVPVRVAGPGLSDEASFYLPLGDEQRAELRGFFGTHCGL